MGTNQQGVADRRSFVGTVAAVAGLTRLRNCAAAAAATLMGAYLAAGRDGPLSDGAVRAAMTVAAIVATANVLNDTRDVEIDRLMKPGRAIPSGRVSIESARRMALWLGASSMLLAATLGAGPATVAAVFLALSVAYCHRLKSTVLVGNTVVAFLSASTFVYGAAVTGGETADALVAAVVILPFMLAFEVLKCIEDRDADATAGVRTVATAWGPRRSLVLCRCLLAGLAAGLAVAGGAGWAPAGYVIATLVVSVLPSLVAVATLGPAPSEASTRARVHLMKVAWFTGLSSVALLG